MEKKIEEAVKNYQCSGCSNGYDTTCYKQNIYQGMGCGNHYAGTIISSIGSVFLGMPKGFNRLGMFADLKPIIFESFVSSSYDIYNIPVWKYLSKEGHTFVRGIMPRKNEPFIHIYLENCIDKIDCLEITQENIDYMD